MKPPNFEKRFSVLPRWARVAVWFGFVGVLLVAALALGECGMRIQGRKPWNPHVAWDFSVEPGGKLFQRHATLGFSQIPGHFTVTFPDGYVFGITNDEDGLRITHLREEEREESKPEIWIFGCSFTYGLGIDDDETFPWRLQERFPEYEVVSFAQCGYGTLQSLLQLREALEEGRQPAFVVLTYAQFHAERNTLRRRWRKGFFYYNTLGPLQQPYARLDGKGELVIRMGSSEYKGFPFMRHSALSHSLEEKFDLLAERYVIRSDEVSRALVKEFWGECRSRDIPFVVADLDADTQRMADFCREAGIPAIDISVDYCNEQRFNLLPHDNHPNAEAHRVYADRLEAYLRRVLEADDGS